MTGQRVTTHRALATLAATGLALGLVACTKEDDAKARLTDCEVVEYDGRTYRLTTDPEGTGPGVGRILGEGRAEQCPEGTGGAVTVYSVNEQPPEEAITVSDDHVVALYTTQD